LLAIITNAARFFIVLALKPTGLTAIPNRRDCGKAGCGAINTRRWLASLALALL